MTPATVHQLPTRPPSTVVRLVGPGAVPPGAVVLGHVVALPAATLAADPGILLDHETPVEALIGTSAGTGFAPRPGLVVDAHARRVIADGVELALTRREFDLLAHLVTHPGRVFTRGQLLSGVWDLPGLAGRPLRTVDVHVSRVRRKLGRHGHSLHSLRGVGYRWSARPEHADGDR